MVQPPANVYDLHENRSARLFTGPKPLSAIDTPHPHSTLLRTRQLYGSPSCPTTQNINTTLASALSLLYTRPHFEPTAVYKLNCLGGGSMRVPLRVPRRHVLSMAAAFCPPPLRPCYLICPPCPGYCTVCICSCGSSWMLVK